MTKVCSLCKHEKPLKHFHSRSGTTSKYHWCISCYTKYKTAKALSKKKMFVRFCGNKCKRCGIKHTGHNTTIFDFHHKDPSKKDADWTRMRRWAVERIRPEIVKCMLLCSNCHRLVHKYIHLRK